MAVATAPISTPMRLAPTEIRVISHSTLFYWWPVWAVGFLLTILTVFDGHFMLIVPRDTVA